MPPNQLAILAIVVGVIVRQIGKAIGTHLALYEPTIFPTGLIVKGY